MVTKALEQHTVSIFKVEVTLKMEAVASFETLVTTYNTTLHDNPKPQPINISCLMVN
jgi:hypothetical protein